jgi:hypothetical protein
MTTRRKLTRTGRCARHQHRLDEKTLRREGGKDRKGALGPGGVEGQSSARDRGRVDGVAGSLSTLLRRDPKGLTMPWPAHTI